ncbi:hypothetical protein EDD16DRAFT_1716682 [Pisolithus croceorrhizus]|nr:hypothetical protein EDD16DRAFT_1716682 [Pisolithus croceorrhizus]
MSQPLLHIPTPLATAVQGWSAVLDSAIQSDSDDDKAVMKAKYDKRQHQKKAQKDQKAAEEAAAWERAEAECQEREAAELHRWEEAEHQEKEENEHQEKEENEHQEREVNKCWEREVEAWVASQVKGTGSQSHHSVVSLSALTEPDLALAEGSQSQGGSLLAKASKCRKKSCDQCSSVKEQCMLAGTKKVWKCVVLAESTSPRAGEKKKHAWAKSLEVEVVGGSSQTEKGKSVTCDTSITSGLYTIATVIDWHTEEVAQLWQMVESLGSLHHQVIKSIAELLQEMTYSEPELPAESGSEESKEAEASDELGWK